MKPVSYSGSSLANIASVARADSVADYAYLARMAALCQGFLTRARNARLPACGGRSSLAPRDGSSSLAQSSCARRAINAHGTIGERTSATG